MILSEHLNNFEQGLINEKKTADNFDKSNPVYKSLVEHAGKVNTKLCKTSLDKTALYEFALKEALHNEFPDKHWSEITGCDIRATLLESGNDIDKTARRIVESLKVKQEKETVKKETGALKENMSKKSLKEAKYDLYVNGDYVCSSDRYKRAKDFKQRVFSDKHVDYPGEDWFKTGKLTRKDINDTDKVVVKRDRTRNESLKESESEYKTIAKLSRGLEVISYPYGYAVTDGYVNDRFVPRSSGPVFDDGRFNLSDKDKAKIKRLIDSGTIKIQESLKESAEWKYTLSCSDDLESAIDGGDLEEVIEALKGAYDELVDQELLDEGRRDKVVSALEQIDVYDDGAEAKIEKRLDQFYNVCDKLGVKISFNESLKEGVSKKEVIDAIIANHGCSKKEAEKQFKEMSDERKELLVQGFKENAKKSFLTDSLKEGKSLKEKYPPKNVTFTASEVQLDSDDEADDDEIISEILSDLLSDTYGYCHNGFNYEVKKNEFGEPSEFICTDIDWDLSESLKEDTVKQGSSWVNKGKEGTHGKFKTKKGADAQRKAMFANGYKEGLKESYEDFTNVDVLAKAIDDAYDDLVSDPDGGGCYTLELDNRLAVCVGWEDGFEPEDTPFGDGWGIVTGIKVWTSDDMRTDYEWINAPFYRGGDVWDTTTSIGKGDGKSIAPWLLKEYEEMKNLPMTEQGEIIEVPEQVVYSKSELDDLISRTSVGNYDFDLQWEIGNKLEDDYGLEPEDFDYEIKGNDVIVSNISWKLNESKSSRKGKKLTEAPIYDLTPQYDSRQSFYSKAKVDTGEKGDKNKLYSYNTLVAEIKDGKPVVYGTYSSTTLRHIKDWLRQNGFKADSSKQIMADYGTKDEALTEKRDSKEVKDRPFDYERRLLARLKSDCDYALGACKDNGSSFEGVQKHFWAGNSGNQIAKMRELHQLSKDMDDIVTDSDIDTYEKRFRDWSKQEALTEASDGKSVENEFKNYRAFVANFSPVTIKKNGKQYYVFKKGDEDGKHWIQYGNKDYIDGWLYGAVQAKMKIVESAKSKGGKKNLKEGLSYGEMAAIEDEWAKYKERHGIKGFADADVALAFIEEECAEVYPTQDEQDEIFTHIGLIEEGGEYDESLKEGNKNESVKSKGGKKPLKEGTSNFYSMDYFPLLVFDDCESAWEYADQQARDEIESDYDNMTDEEIEAYEEDAFNYPRYENLLVKAYDEYLNYCLLEEEEIDSLKDEIDSFNDSMKKKYWYDSGWNPNGVKSLDGEDWEEYGVYPSVEIKPGYYEAAQLYVNVEPKGDVIQNYKFFIQEQVDEVNKFLEEMKKKYGLTELGVAYRFDNGETGYSKK